MKMNIVIPMAGAGSRFKKMGFKNPKPLIDVRGKTMIQTVIEPLNFQNATYIYIVQKKHRVNFNLDDKLNFITPNCKIVEVDGLTDGAACSVLLAKKYIDNQDPLIIMNSDNLILFDSEDFINKSKNYDGSIICFIEEDNKWSFVKTNNENLITEVAEKKQISNYATAGLYFWKKGLDFVKFSEKMIEKNIRTNNEFYVCPVFNEAIQDGKKIRVKNIEKMWGIGTPEDLNYFIEQYKGNV
jgi:dTDP-glucose pyrophosphorylase